MAEQVHLTRFACGCHYDGGSEERDDGPTLTYCPLHDAAPALLDALEDLLAITRESQGVVGWHLNGAIADWGEFEGVAAGEHAIALARGEPARA